VKQSAPAPTPSASSKPLSREEALRKIAALPPEVQDLLSLRYPAEVLEANLLMDVERILAGDRQQAPEEKPAERGG
jgi:hypothetical protein